MRSVRENGWTEEKIISKLSKMVKEKNMTTMPTHTEMFDYFGDYSVSNAVRRGGGTKYFSEILGLETKDCESRFGDDFELYFMFDVMQRLGFDSEKMKPRYPYDVLVERVVKVDVKAALPFNNYGRSKYYSFNLEKKSQTCDLFVFYCVSDDGNEVTKTYIVPSSVLSGKTQFSIGVKNSKYDCYIDRWDIIKRYKDFISRAFAERLNS